MSNQKDRNPIGLLLLVTTFSGLMFILMMIGFYIHDVPVNW